eukprot:TRINITY_DN30277_c0_g1_i1.p2 TRINITY_DN30277_c0_g1~~TRINITY_DN30277_c0_g1_i1.p2  ORF type:complete len:315 (+),score=77.78 TRINITY_DN30277_c0_g1_i1:988-1932(+)
MKHQGIAMSPNVYAIQLSIAGSSEEVQRLVGEMSHSSIACDAHVYDAVISAIGRVRPGDVQAAEAVLKTAETEGVRPDIGMYHSMLEVHRVAGDAVGAGRLFRKMLVDHRPQPHTVTIALGACLVGTAPGGGRKQKAVEMAEWLFTLCVRNSQRLLTDYVYGMMMQVYSRAGEDELSVRMFDRMQREGIAPTSKIHGLAIDALSKTGQADRAAAIERLPSYQAALSRRAARERRTPLDELPRNRGLLAADNAEPAEWVVEDRKDERAKDPLWVGLSAAVDARVADDPDAQRGSTLSRRPHPSAPRSPAGSILRL